MAQSVNLVELLSVGTRTNFNNLRPLQKILFLRAPRNSGGVSKAWLGTVKILERQGKQVLTIVSEHLWQNGVLSTRYLPKEERMQMTSQDLIYLIEDISESQKQSFREQRRMYAQQRDALRKARSAQDEYFDLIGCTPHITAEEFRHINRQLNLKYHPDRCHDEELSKKYMTALSFVREYIKVRDSRISN